MKIQMLKQQKGVKKQYGRFDISIFGIQPVDTLDTGKHIWGWSNGHTR